MPVSLGDAVLGDHPGARVCLWMDIRMHRVREMRLDCQAFKILINIVVLMYFNNR